MTLKHISSFIDEKDMDVDTISLENGSGVFLLEGGKDKTKTVKVHYYKPLGFNKDSDVVIILPGAGRNAPDYRDAWIIASEKKNILILSLEYSEKHYPGFWNYNLAGMIYDVNVKTQEYKIKLNSDDWIFNDFDRVFNLVKSELKLNKDSFVLFGHSAGGQILHRLALFNTNNKAKTIIAANSGWYTIPNLNDVFPYGLKKSGLTKENINFTNNLVVFLGEHDNASETRGHLRRSPEVDKQGLHRLARGQYFYKTSKSLSDSLNKAFSWKLSIIPDVGHDYKKMSQAAAKYLYD